MLDDRAREGPSEAARRAWRPIGARAISSRVGRHLPASPSRGIARRKMARRLRRSRRACAGAGSRRPRAGRGLSTPARKRATGSARTSSTSAGPTVCGSLLFPLRLADAGRVGPWRELVATGSRIVVLPTSSSRWRPTACGEPHRDGVADLGVLRHLARPVAGTGSRPDGDHRSSACRRTGTSRGRSASAPTRGPSGCAAG